MKLRRVLVVAENASTRMGGEGILPYHYFRLLRARGMDAHLLVHDRTRTELATAFPNDLDHIHFVADQALQKIFYRIGKLLPRRISEATFGLANQMLTQASQRALVRSLVIPGTVVHQPIPVSPRFPSLLSGLGAPLVCGPLNGGMEWPEAFRGTEAAWSRAVIALGRTFTDVFNGIFPGKRCAAVVVVANARTRTALPSRLEGRIAEIPENGVDASQWPQASPAADPGRFVFVGRLVDWKALDIAIDAIAKVPGASLDVIGDGPMLPAWRAHAEALGAPIRFHGFLSQAQSADFLKSANALLLPSLYECGGAVVLEAMAMSLPVIATAWGGPLDYLDPTCGFLIPPTSRASLVEGFTQAIHQLLADPALRNTLGTAGRTRVLEYFEWDRKLTAMIEVYESTLAKPQA